MASWSGDEIAGLRRRRSAGASWSQLAAWASEATGREVSANAVRLLFRNHPAVGDAPAVVAPTSPELPIEELIEQRKRKYARRHAHEEARRLIRIDLPSLDPFGILFFGDPHLDDDGCDLGAVEAHSAIARRTPGLYAANVGDTTNNWIGRLARLYAEQSTTGPEAWRLAEWFVGGLEGKWLWIVGGNHDAWSGHGDPMQWISRQAGALYQSSEVRVGLRLPGGRQIRVNNRHDFSGHSMWNPGHGPGKALQLGLRDHLAVAGHRHITSASVLKDPESRIAMHALVVGSYKIHDRYARERHFRDQQLSPCALVTFDARLPDAHPDLLKIFHDPAEGAAYLGWLRRRAGAASRTPAARRRSGRGA